MPTIAQTFDDTSLGEQPPKTGNTGDPAWPTGGLPTATGTPPSLIQTAGLDSPRADLTQMGPTHFATPGNGVKAWPAIQSYEESEV